MDAQQLTTLGGLLSVLLALLAYLRTMKDDLRSEIVASESRTGARIDEVKTDLGARIDEVKTDLGARIDEVKTDLGARIDGVDHRLDTIERRTYDIGRVLPPPAPPHAS